MLELKNGGDNNAIYLIGFTHASSGDRVNPQGIGSILLSGTDGDIRFWYIELDPSEFSGPDAEANLENIQWLTPRVLAHQEAVDAISAIGAIYPARFATLFSSLSVLRQSVRAWSKTLNDYFQKVNGKREFGLKVFVTESSESRPRTASNDKAETGGRGYLLARRVAAEAKKRRSATLSNIVTDISDMLSDLGADVSRRSVVTLADPDDERTLIGNIAVLIDEGNEGVIDKVSHAFSGQYDHIIRIDTVISGPWAPYSFCPDLQTAEAESTSLGSSPS
jgi:hypothetical protein